MSPDWKPLVLTEFEVGYAFAMIEAVTRAGKPLAQVGQRSGVPTADIVTDLLGCAEMVDALGRVGVWTQVGNGQVSFGFYLESWVREALNFIDRTPLQQRERDWLNGMLFGYKADVIQRFLDKQAPNAQP